MNVGYKSLLQLRFGGGQTEQGRPGKGRPFEPNLLLLLLLLARFLASALAGQCCFYTLFFAWLEVKGVTLDLLNNVFLLYLALETAQSVLKGLALLQSYFCQNWYTPKLVRWDRIVISRFEKQVKEYVGVGAGMLEIRKWQKFRKQLVFKRLGELQSGASSDSRHGLRCAKNCGLSESGNREESSTAQTNGSRLRNADTVDLAAKLHFRLRLFRTMFLQTRFLQTMFVSDHERGLQICFRRGGVFLR